MFQGCGREEGKKKAVGSQEGVMVTCLSGPGGEGAGAAEARIQTSERLNTMARRNVRKERKIRLTWGKKTEFGGIQSDFKDVFGIKYHFYSHDVDFLY